MKTIVITGASDGIGAAAARQLKAMGHNVVIVGRNREKTEKIANELNAPYHVADYSRLADVVRLAEELKAYEHIDVLCNNAGGVLNERTVTEDGFERTFQVNVLAQHLLTRLLLEKLCADKTTVIQTSSIASNLFGQKLDVTDLQNEKAYDPVKAYGEAKLCDALFTRELNARYGAQGIKAVAFEPGVVRSNFASESAWFFRFAYHSFFKYLFTISTEKSARRMVWLATEDAFVPGETYSEKKIYKIKYKDGDGAKARSLFDQCEAMIAPYLQ